MLRRFSLQVITIFMLLSMSNFSFAYVAAELKSDCEAFIKINYAPQKNTTTELHFQAGKCIGYISGAGEARIETLSQLSSVTLDPEVAKNVTPFCVPEAVTAEHLVEVVVNYLDAHPIDMHYPAVTTLNKILTLTYPCKSKDGKKK